MQRRLSRSCFQLLPFSHSTHQIDLRERSHCFVAIRHASDTAPIEVPYPYISADDGLMVAKREFLDQTGVRHDDVVLMNEQQATMA